MLKIVNIFLIIIITILFTACSDKQKKIKKVISKPVLTQKTINNYKKALSYENKDGIINGNNYANYRYYLDKAIEEKNPQAYLKAFNDYKNPIGKKANIKGKLKIVSKEDKQKAAKFALLAIQNQKNKKIACDTIKQIGEQNIFDKEQSYKIYLANKTQGCINIDDKNFDFLFTPSISFIQKTKNSDKYKEKNEQILKELINNNAQKAIDGNLITKYEKYDDRWLILSKIATNLAFISYKKKNEELAGYYLALAKKIIQSTPLNKNRYFKYDPKEKNFKKYYHNEARDKIIQKGSDEILKMLLKMI